MANKRHVAKAVWIALKKELWTDLLLWLTFPGLQNIVHSLIGRSRRDLSGAWLIEADLIEVNLSGANLSKAKFWEANLSGANLSGADLSGAWLMRAHLRAANLSGAMPAHHAA
jgi:uncharacterized protein YjbI with pentapeptide repeats